MNNLTFGAQSKSLFTKYNSWTSHITIWITWSSKHIFTFTMSKKFVTKYNIWRSYMTIWITWRSEHILTFRMSQNYKYSVAEGSSSEWAMHVTWQQNIYREVLYQRIRQFLQTANFTKKWKTHSNTYQWRQYIDKTKQTQPFADVFQKSVLKNYAIFLKICNFAKKRLQHRCFPVNVVKIFRRAFYTEYFRWLLLTRLQWRPDHCIFLSLYPV